MEPSQEKNTCITLPEDVSWIIGRLQRQGYDAYAVGGCVRDCMLGRKPQDWDITTSARPFQVKALFDRTIDTGIEHGTVTVMRHHVGYEVTTYRIDGEYEDGRHPKAVEFTGNLSLDLERRDFTINAMAYNDQDGLVDIFGGMEDLRRGVIRCVGDPGDRFDEDALRMLRAVRFSGQLGFEIDPATREAILERVDKLHRISAERIRVEMTKLLVSQGAGQFREVYRTGMTTIFLPEFDVTMDCDQRNLHHIYTVGEHSIRSVEIMNSFFEKEKLRRLPALSDEARERILRTARELSDKQHVVLAVTMLLHDIAKPVVMTVDEDGVGHFKGHPEEGAQMARGILRRLTFDNETVDQVKRLIRYHDYRFGEKESSVRRGASRIGADLFEMEMLVFYADVLAQNPEKMPPKLERLDQTWMNYEKIVLAGQALSVRDLAVTGRDLIAAGVTPGPGLGEILGEMLELVLDQPEYNKKEKLLTWLTQRQKR